MTKYPDEEHSYAMNHDFSKQLEALRDGCGMAPLPERAFLRVTGADSTRWLNGMVTNSVAALAPGEGAYTFLLNAQGRIQGDCTLFRELGDGPASFLLSTTAAQLEVLHPWLDRYIIMDDVELTRAFEEETSFLLLGGGLPQALQSISLPTPDPLRLFRSDTPNGPVLLSTPAHAPESSHARKVELRGAPSLIGGLRGELLRSGAIELAPEVLEADRIREGMPRFGVDIRDRDLPQETGQTQALHFNKGCYLGQEIVERIRSRGQVHRVFSRFEVSGKLPETFPVPLEARVADAAKPAGELTSAAELPEADGTPCIVALGYIRREFLSMPTQLYYEGGTAVALSHS